MERRTPETQHAYELNQKVLTDLSILGCEAGQAAVLQVAAGAAGGGGIEAGETHAIERVAVAAHFFGEAARGGERAVARFRAVG